MAGALADPLQAESLRRIPTRQPQSKMASGTPVYINHAIVPKDHDNAGPGRDAAINKKTEGRAGNAIDKPVDARSRRSL